MANPKIILEIRFSKRIPRKALEELVILFSESKQEMKKELSSIDPNPIIRVWYEGQASEEDIELPSFMRLFKKKSKGSG